MLIQIIISSVRKGRICDQVAEWVTENTEKIIEETKHSVEVVDLKDWKLPMDDEPNLPKTGLYTQEHTKAFSKKIASADAFIFVTPKYNGSYPASLKNAIDHLFNEWTNKPAAIVNYTYTNNNAVIDKLGDLLKYLKMPLVKDSTVIQLSKEIYNNQNRIADYKTAFSVYNNSLRTTVQQLAALLEK